jgi:hypothetical protein
MRPELAEVKKDGAITPLLHISSWRADYLIKHRNKFTTYSKAGIGDISVETRSCDRHG